MTKLPSKSIRKSNLNGENDKLGFSIFCISEINGISKYDDVIAGDYLMMKHTKATT